MKNTDTKYIRYEVTQHTFLFITNNINKIFGFNIKA